MCVGCPKMQSTSNSSSTADFEVVEEGDNLGVIRCGVFTPLTNFTFMFVHKVLPPPQVKQLNGFLVDVVGHQSRGSCFLPWHKTQQKGLNLAKELGTAVPSSALMSKLSPSEMKDVFWMKLSEYHNDPSRTEKVAVSGIGLQEDGLTYVCSPDVQVGMDGCEVPPAQQKYLWVQEIVESTGVIPKSPLLRGIPNAHHALKHFLMGLHTLSQKNFISSLFVLGSVVSSVVYEGIVSRFGSCGVSIAFGRINRGKSKSVEMALAALGVRGAMYSSISDALLRKLLLGTMPWAFDDPDDAEQLQKILLSVFGNTSIGNVQHHGCARVAPTATANDHIVEDLASRDERILCRVKFIPFVHEVPYNLANVSKIKNAFELAPGALPHLLYCADQVLKCDMGSLEKIMEFVNESIPNLDSRIALDYTLSIAFPIMIARECSEQCNGTETFDLEEYGITHAFDEYFVPVIKKYQVAAECSPIGSYLLCAARALSPAEILKVVNPYCSYMQQGKGVSGVAIILREFLKCLDALDIPHMYEADIRRRLRKRNDCKTSANQHFLSPESVSTTIDRSKGDTRNMSCVIVPRRDVPDSFFTLLQQDREDKVDFKATASLQDSASPISNSPAFSPNRSSNVSAFSPNRSSNGPGFSPNWSSNSPAFSPNRSSNGTALSPNQNCNSVIFSSKQSCKGAVSSDPKQSRRGAVLSPTEQSCRRAVLSSKQWDNAAALSPKHSRKGEVLSPEQRCKGAVLSPKQRRKGAAVLSSKQRGNAAALSWKQSNASTASSPQADKRLKAFTHRRQTFRSRKFPMYSPRRAALALSTRRMLALQLSSRKSAIHSPKRAALSARRILALQLSSRKLATYSPKSAALSFVPIPKKAFECSPGRAQLKVVTPLSGASRFSPKYTSTPLSKEKCAPARKGSLPSSPTCQAGSVISKQPGSVKRNLFGIAPTNLQLTLTCTTRDVDPATMRQKQNRKGKGKGKKMKGQRKKGKGKKVWTCGKCNEMYIEGQGDWIGCDAAKCDNWYHFECVGVTKAPRGKWHCSDH